MATLDGSKMIIRFNKEASVCFVDGPSKKWKVYDQIEDGFFVAWRCVTHDGKYRGMINVTKELQRDGQPLYQIRFVWYMVMGKGETTVTGTCFSLDQVAIFLSDMDILKLPKATLRYDGDFSP